MEVTNEIVKRESASDSDIAEAVAKCIAWTRTQITPKETIFLIQEVQNLVREDFRCYCLIPQEIQTAFRKGVFGEYGKYYGINAVTLISFLKEYVNSDEFIHSRQQESQRLARLALPPKATVTDEEVTQGYVKLILDAIDDYRNQNSMPIFATRIYDFMDTHDLINIKKEKKFEYMRKAEEQMQREVKKAKGIKLRDLLRKYSDAKFAQATQVGIAKTLVLRDIFDKADDDFIYRIKSLIHK